MSAESTYLDGQFEEHRQHLRAVAYRMLGSLSEADDAVQEAWLRVRRADTATGSAQNVEDIDNIGGWFTTITARVCLNMLRSRTRRREDPLDPTVPDPLIAVDEQHEPEHAALLADSVSLALLVVLDLLSPAERLAFVMHDLFDLPYEEVGAMLDRSPLAVRQLASRARRRVRGAATSVTNHSRIQQRRVVDAFFAAARDGDLDTLARVLDPHATLRIDAGPQRPHANVALRGAQSVAAQTVRGLASSLKHPDVELRPVHINGAPGVVATKRGRPISIIGFAFSNERICEISAIADPQRLAALTDGL